VRSASQCCHHWARNCQRFVVLLLRSTKRLLCDWTYLQHSLFRTPHCISRYSTGFVCSVRSMTPYGRLDSSSTLAIVVVAVAQCGHVIIRLEDYIDVCIGPKLADILRRSDQLRAVQYLLYAMLTGTMSIFDIHHLGLSVESKCPRCTVA
jgi:hypothetical protein